MKTILRILLITFVFIIIIDLIIFIPGLFSEKFETKFIAKKELRETTISFLFIFIIYYMLKGEKLNKNSKNN